MLEMTNIRKDSEIQVSKGNILSFGRQMDEISSRGSKALYDRHTLVHLVEKIGGDIPLGGVILLPMILGGDIYQIHT
jgi:hypothetical protein